ncbi:MAG TPA: hypothetical protein VNA26_03735 [Chitinophagaceae bacterium]|nr:hypothetical protein [Chitinophagaceae bacterium]
MQHIMLNKQKTESSLSEAFIIGVNERILNFIEIFLHHSTMGIRPQQVQKVISIAPQIARLQTLSLALNIDTIKKIQYTYYNQKKGLTCKYLHH